MGDGDKYGFVQTVKTVTDGEIPLSKYRSEVSGLTVCIAEVEGPLVAGYLCVATEARDDDGLPHTLEHLVFMGSEKYPYKGILDNLANRCLASGTNAWTDTDHTCYTIKTAGSEGFLKLLPIYVEHLLYPLLTDSAYATEVHHINSEGEDDGVVYEEMQARESGGLFRCHLQMLRAMFPGDCGYRYETGGMLKNLRESTNNEKVRAYHKEYYRPENLCIMIMGQIEAEEVFKSLQSIEERIKREGERKPFVKPWQIPVPPLDESVTAEIQYPNNDEDSGMVIASWRGPEAKDYSQLICVQVFMEYLTESSLSPFLRDFVDADDPYCNQLDYTLIENSVSCIYLHFANVPTGKLKHIRKKVLNLLERIGNGTEELDMKRMESVIQKKRLYILKRMEDSSHDQLAMSLIGDFLYGSTLEDLELRVQQIPIIENLLSKNAEFWKALIKSYMVEGKYVFVLGHSSPKLADNLADAEKKRIAEQLKRLGPEGLKKCNDILLRAMKENEIAPPEDVINSISIPSVDSVKFHPIRRSTNCSNEYETTATEFALDKMPCRFQLDIVKSNFVRMYVLLDTSDVPQLLRMFLPLFVELIVESPIHRNGEVIPYQEVVKQLDNDTIAKSCSIGLNYSRFSCEKFPQVVCLELMVEEEQYAKGVQWIRELLFHTVFQPLRIKTTINKMIADVAKMKRNGIFIAKTMLKNLCFSQESNHWATSMIRQEKFLTELQQTLAIQPDEVVKALNDLREHVTRVDHMTIHLAVNLPNLRQKTALEDPWTRDFLPPNVQPAIAKCLPKPCYELLVNSNSKTSKDIMIGVEAVDSSYLSVVAPCINSFTHPDYPALVVLIQYLTQPEGPLGTQMRGVGMTYHLDMFVHPNEGLIYFLMFRSFLVVRGYKEAKKTVEYHLSNPTAWDTSLVESACSSLIFEIIQKVKTVSDTVEQSVSAYYKNVDMNFTKTLLEHISKVTPADMQRVGDIYVRPLFNPDVSKCAICCHPTKVNNIVNTFKQYSRDLTVVSSLEDLFMSQY